MPEHYRTNITQAVADLMPQSVERFQRVDRGKGNVAAEDDTPAVFVFGGDERVQTRSGNAYRVEMDLEIEVVVNDRDDPDKAINDAIGWVCEALEVDLTVGQTTLCLDYNECRVFVVPDEPAVQVALLRYTVVYQRRLATPFV